MCVCTVKDNYLNIFISKRVSKKKTSHAKRGDVHTDLADLEATEQGSHKRSQLSSQQPSDVGLF